MNRRLATIRYLLGFLLVFSAHSAAQVPSEGRLHKLLDSGGPLLREQAAYDVLFYRLNVTIDTLTRSISGTTLTRALATDTLSTFVLDLNTNFTVSSAVWKGRTQFNTALQVSRNGGRIWISLPFVVQKSDTISVELTYSGKPKVAANPPWDDGFVWKRARTGELWAGVACEEEGGDVWWPCKDHPSDEPDSVALSFTVPSNLVCVSNGKLLGTADNGNGTRTYQWYVGQTINNYNVTFYLGPYVRIPVDYTSVTGAKIPAEYWFLPYNVDSVKNIMPTWLKDIRFLEETCGPYPFRAEKYCIVDAPYAGMEHQTSVAYGVYGGSHFNANWAGYGFDYIHLHEMAHEWWGNLVTAKDWSDLWIHEGFATYMEALFVERQSGFARYKSYMARMRPQSITRPIAPNQSVTAGTAYLSNVYNGGAWVLHTLRSYVGDSTFFRLLRRWAYPDPAMESVTNGRQCRLATVEEFRQIAEQVSGKTLDWFFTVYLRQAGLPQLTVERRSTFAILRWFAPNNVAFPMPVEVQVGKSRYTVDMSSGTGTFSAHISDTVSIDPDARIFMTTPKIVSVEAADDLIPRDFALSVYPNPFNPTTTLRIDVPKRMQVRGEIFSVSGERIGEIVNSWLEAGTHSVTIDLGNQSSGVYFVVVRGDERVLTKKLVLLR
jgi:aminopeptidase N